MNEELKIDEEFQALFPPLAPDVFDGLKEDCRRYGIREPIYTWHDENGNEVIIDGHNRYRVSQELGIPFTTICMDDELKNRDAVIDFMLKTQLNRRNLTPWERSKIVLQRKDTLAEKAKENQRLSEGRGQKGLANLPNLNTRETLANQAGVSPRTMGKADAIYSSDAEDLKQNLDRGHDDEGRKVSIDSEYKKLRARLAQAEQERDEAKTENVQLKANFSTAVSDKAFEIQGESVRAKKAAEQARDEAEAKAESFRAKADAYDDLQKTNHSLREKIRQQADELANRPNVETVVTKEVIPDEYKKALLENQQLKKELAAHRAHAQNMTVQELAQTDKEFDDLQKSYEEEERTSKRLEYFETLSSFFPEGQIEARELARCFLKFHGNEPAIVHTVQQNLRLAIDSMTWIYDALTAKPKLEVVK